MSIDDLCAGDVLIVVDVQSDFLPGGALGVPGGEAVIEPLNRYIEAFARGGHPVLLTRDWHPRDHCSFRPQGGRWPAHCVAGTKGAEFAPNLVLPPTARVVSKATRSDEEAYSAFQGTDLAARLRDLECTRVFIGGLATDYCVRATALDARAAGFEVVVLKEAVRPVNVDPGDGQRALQEMSASGVQLC